MFLLHAALEYSFYHSIKTKSVSLSYTSNVRHSLCAFKLTRSVQVRKQTFLRKRESNIVTSAWSHDMGMRKY